jgi:hypothetical protein
LVLRPERSEDEDYPEIHYSLIASTNQLIKDATGPNWAPLSTDIAGMGNDYDKLLLINTCHGIHSFLELLRHRFPFIRRQRVAIETTRGPKRLNSLNQILAW